VRLRDLGLSIGRGCPGPRNAITDVAGVRVGHATIVRGGAGQDGPVVRTGVTVIDPRPGWVRESPCYAGAHSFNGNGECTGLEWVRESGLLTTPIALTTTHSVGVVRDAMVRHDFERGRRSEHTRGQTFWSMPVVGETYDGVLSDGDGQHVTAEDLEAALAELSVEVAEGAVGGGIGTSSRILTAEDGGWTVGALVQANYGRREELRIDGWPVGSVITTDDVPSPLTDLDPNPPGSGSIIVVLATDAPLLADQCRRLAARAGVGLGRVGGGTCDSSGDIFVAFATGNDSLPPESYGGSPPQVCPVATVPHQRLDRIFEAAAEATEEAIVNALLAATTMTGVGGRTAHGLEPSRLVAALDALRRR
jgi:D-aminopeptidase